jgi:lipoate synthase
MNGIRKTERKNAETKNVEKKRPKLKRQKKKYRMMKMSKLEDVVNCNIHTSRMLGFHNRFHQHIQRSHPMIRSFKKCPPEGELDLDTFLRQMELVLMVAQKRQRSLQYNNVLIH